MTERHHINGFNPTVPEHEEQSRFGDSDQGWPKPAVVMRSMVTMQGMRPGTSVPTADSIMSLSSCRLSPFNLSKQVVITFYCCCVLHTGFLTCQGQGILCLSIFHMPV